MKTFYIRPEEIAKKLGIDIKKINFNEVKDNWKKNIKDLCGYIEKDKNEKIIIYYNSNQKENRIRFTIAHELGHILLGHLNNEKLHVDFIDSFKNTNTNLKEIEANKFAIELLIPEDKLEFLIYKKGITSIKEIARIMFVSEVAILIRLKNLGWIN